MAAPGMILARSGDAIVLIIVYYVGTGRGSLSNLVFQG